AAISGCISLCLIFSFFRPLPTSEIYTLSLHDALPISSALFAAVEDDNLGAVKRLLAQHADANARDLHCSTPLMFAVVSDDTRVRSEEHTSELQSLRHLVCRLLLEKKKHQTLHRNNHHR